CSRTSRLAWPAGLGLGLPPTPPLSLGESGNPSQPRKQSTPVGFPLRNARRSRSPGERVRVRGKKPPRPATRTTSLGRARIARRAIFRIVGIHDSKPPALPEVADFRFPL